MNKTLLSKGQWKNQARLIGSDYPFNEKLVDTYFAVFEHSEHQGWRGACHGISSILYVLLKEQDIYCELHRGYVKPANRPQTFAHSWVTIEDKVFDIALYRGNPSFINAKPWEYDEISAPIFNGINLERNERALVSYDVPFELEGQDRTFLKIKGMTFVEYMNGGQAPYGLWGDVMEIAKGLKLNVNIQELKEKYANQQLIL
jgi:hypothetical protein